jgi:hypothetical protein
MFHITNKKGGGKEMKTLALVLVGCGLAISLGHLALAGSTAQQTVTYQVDAINEISVSGDPANLVVNSAIAGSEPVSDTDYTTSWAITTNQTARKMTGAINSDMPANVTLEINLIAPTGGSSEGDVSLSSADADLVTSIETVAESGLTITYTLSATVAAGVVTQAQKTVTLTLTAE